MFKQFRWYERIWICLPCGGFLLFLFFAAGDEFAALDYSLYQSLFGSHRLRHWLYDEIVSVLAAGFLVGIPTLLINRKVFLDSRNAKLTYLMTAFVSLLSFAIFFFLYLFFFFDMRGFPG
jgi:hypothetical protein